MAASARRRRSRAPTPSASSPASTFCNTVSHGNSAKVLNTIATPCAGPDKGFPRYSTAPPLGSIRPAMMRNKVDFPEPERPSRPTISPSASLRLTSSRTRNSPYVLLNPRCTRVTRRISDKLTVFQPDGKNPQCLVPNQYQGLALVALFCRGALCLYLIPPSDINQNLLKKYIAYPGIFSMEFAIRPYVGRAEKGSNPAAACFPHKDTADAIIGGSTPSQIQTSPQCRASYAAYRPRRSFPRYTRLGHARSVLYRPRRRLRTQYSRSMRRRTRSSRRSRNREKYPAA